MSEQKTISDFQFFFLRNIKEVVTIVDSRFIFVARQIVGRRKYTDYWLPTNFFSLNCKSDFSLNF